MEHEHPVAQPCGADLEPGPVRREGVGAVGPRLRRVDSGADEAAALGVRGDIDDVVLVIVEHHLEHPAGGVALSL